MIKLKNILLEVIHNEENFKRWFKNSKVVDANGNPLMVKHGTGSTFTAFNKKQIKPISKLYFDFGIHFTEDD